ncbi:MAG: hypothetical protein ABWX56_00440 [Mycetocola sp.]
MIQTFLRVPRGAAEMTADALRLLGVVSIVVALIGWPWVDVAVFALALVGLVIPRFLGVRPGLDIAFCIIVLVAAWSALLELYDALEYLDFVVHFFLNGLTAAVLYILAVRLEVVPDPTRTPVPLGAIVALTTAFGLAAGVIWELAEWIGYTYIDDSIFVSYDDTIADFAAGGLGSILAGLFGRYLVDESRYVPSRPVLRGETV